jgi:predicted RecA/RadA family phage recombinase
MAQSLGKYDSITVTATSAITGGTIQVVGATIGVAVDTAATGIPYTLAIRGEFLLPKKAAAGTVTQGSKAYYMTTGGVNKATAVAASGKCIGVWSELTTTTATSAKVLLTGIPLLVAI